MTQPAFTSPNSAARRLIVRADDFGASPGTNDAILDAIDNGPVQCAGILTCGPYLEHRLDELKDRASRINIGLHTAINSEWARLRWGPVAPRADVPGLLDSDGHYYSDTVVTHKHYQLREVMTEIEAQLAKVRACGIEPVYLDCHMGYAWLPGVHDALLALCEREGLFFGDSKQFDRLSTSAEGDWSELTPDELLRPGNSPSDAAAKGAGQAAADVSATDMAHGKPLLIVCHPAYRDAVSESFGLDVALRRDREARLLTRPDFVEAARQHQVELAPYVPLRPGQS